MTRHCPIATSLICYFLMLIVASDCSLSFCQALSTPTKNKNDWDVASSYSSSSSSSSPARRSLLALMIPTTTTVLLFNDEASNALEPRNEVLCGTGFFTNIAQYKCTEIGDISNDGKVKKIKQEEQATMDSLLAKMGVEDSVDDDVQDQSKEKQKQKGAVSDEKK